MVSLVWNRIITDVGAWNIGNILLQNSTLTGTVSGMEQNCSVLKLPPCVFLMLYGRIQANNFTT